MATDITLDDAGGSQVTISAYTTKVVGADLVLDSPERRRVPHGTRRALVHNANDGLTLNWDNDYPGGITLNGVASITPQDTQDILPVLVVNGGIQFEITTVEAHGSPLEPGGIVFRKKQVNLEGFIEELNARLSQLEARIAALEGR